MIFLNSTLQGHSVPSFRDKYSSIMYVKISLYVYIMVFVSACCDVCDYFVLVVWSSELQSLVVFVSDCVVSHAQKRHQGGYSVMHSWGHRTG